MKTRYKIMIGAGILGLLYLWDQRSNKEAESGQQREPIQPRKSIDRMVGNEPSTSVDTLLGGTEFDSEDLKNYRPNFYFPGPLYSEKRA